MYEKDQQNQPHPPTLLHFFKKVHFKRIKASFSSNLKGFTVNSLIARTKN